MRVARGGSAAAPMRRGLKQLNPLGRMAASCPGSAAAPMRRRLKPKHAAAANHHTSGGSAASGAETGEIRDIPGFRGTNPIESQ